MRKDICEFPRSLEVLGEPFLCKNHEKGKSSVTWSAGTLGDYEELTFRRIFSGALGQHMDEQIKVYFSALSKRSTAEFSRSPSSGYFGPVEPGIASDVFAIVQFHFRTALEWISEAGASVLGCHYADRYGIVSPIVDKKNAEFAQINHMDVVAEPEPIATEGDPPPQQSCEQNAKEPDVQLLTYRIFELIEPAIVIEEHLRP